MRVVLDPNVIVSGLLSTRGAPAEILDAIVRLELRPLLSRLLMAELEDVLGRPWFEQRIPARTRRATLDALVRSGEHVEDGATVAFDDDPKDAYLIALALLHDAPLVTGDRALQAAALPIIVLTPRQLADHLNGQ